MANKYANLVGTNKIKDEYSKINTGFDKVEADINNANSRITAVDNRVDTIITTPIDGRTAAQEVVDARVSAVKSKTFATLDARFEETEQDIATHMADNTAHRGIIYRKNLLHNWDFRNPVNQRGRSSYSGAGYTVDGWTLSAQTLNLKEGYVELRRTLVTGTPTLSQYIENYGSYADETLTFSAEVKVTAEKTVTILIMDGVNTYSRSYSPGASEWNIITVSGKINAAPSHLRCAIQIASASAAVGDAVWVRRAKLELGSVSTLANDPPADYGEQLALCQRYAVIKAGQFRAFYVASSSIQFDVPLPVPMRNISPTLETGSIKIYDTIASSQAEQTGFSFSYVLVSLSTIRVMATKTSHGLTDPVLSISGGLFSADL